MSAKILFVALSIPFAAAVWAAPVRAGELLSNGSFETGLSPWTVTANGATSCDADWNVSVSGNATLCSGVANPVNGLSAAFNSFDGNGPQTFSLRQSFVVPAGFQTGTLFWADTYVASYSGTPRVFTISFYDSLGVLIGTAYTFSLPFSGSLGWTNHSTAVTSFLSGRSGQTVQMRVECFIPQNFTGPAGFGADAFSLVAVTGPVVTVSTAITAMQPIGGGLVNVGLSVTVDDPLATKTVAVYSNDNNLTGTNTSFFFNGGYYYPKPAAAQLFGSNLLLRADRYASPGRVYLIVVRATNGSGTGFASTTVVVPFSAYFLTPPSTITAPAVAAKAFCDTNGGAPPNGSPGPVALPPAGSGYDTHLPPTALP